MCICMSKESLKIKKKWLLSQWLWCVMYLCIYVHECLQFCISWKRKEQRYVKFTLCCRLVLEKCERLFLITSSCVNSIRSVFLHQGICDWLCTWVVVKEICIMKHIKLSVFIPHVSASYASAVIFFMSHYNNHWSLTNRKVAYWCIMQIFKCGICAHADGCISMSYLNVLVFVWFRSLTGFGQASCSSCCSLY